MQYFQVIYFQFDTDPFLIKPAEGRHELELANSGIPLVFCHAQPVLCEVSGDLLLKNLFCITQIGVRPRLRIAHIPILQILINGEKMSPAQCHIVLSLKC